MARESRPEKAATHSSATFINEYFNWRIKMEEEKNQKINSRKKHGMFGTRIYRIWSCMKTRCYNKNKKQYNNYGGKGIKVCSDWLEFIPFYEWAKNNGYKENLTIDRINSDGDYEPTNCRFITIQEQQKNRTNIHYVTINGETLCLRDWERKLGLPQGIVSRRIFDGWNIEKALFTPKRK